jgi:hypothetical protein
MNYKFLVPGVLGTIRLEVVGATCGNEAGHFFVIQILKVSEKNADRGATLWEVAISFSSFPRLRARTTLFR